MGKIRESFAKRCFFSKRPFRSANAKSSPRTLKVPRLIILLYCLLFTASYIQASQTYILSYRAQIKNALVISESYYYSKAMRQVKAHPSKQLKIPSSDKPNADVLFEKNKDIIVDFLMKEGLHTRSHEKVYNSKSSSLISISIPPTYITVDFNDDYATITRLILD